jgi:hypothetical protein
MAKGREASHKPLDVLDAPDLTYFSDGRDLIRICFITMLGDDVPQKVSLGDPKGALFWV